MDYSGYMIYYKEDSKETSVNTYTNESTFLMDSDIMPVNSEIELK